MKKILIVDDDMDIIDLVKNRLRKNDYEVISCSEGERGFKTALEQRPDLIIMDIMMPNMSGAEVVKLLKSNDITRYIPILFFTVLASNVPSDTGLDEINVNGQLYPAVAKPFEPIKLLSAVKSLLGE
jgi:CheY-like chemotaxis protein